MTINYKKFLDNFDDYQEYQEGIRQLEKKIIEIKEQEKQNILAEIERKKERELEKKRLKEKARLAEIENIKEQARQTEIRRKKEEEAKLAEIERKNEEIRLARLSENSNQQNFIIGGIIGVLYFSFYVYSFGFLESIGLILGTIVVSIILFLIKNILPRVILFVSIAIIFYINLYFFTNKKVSQASEVANIEVKYKFDEEREREIEERKTERENREAYDFQETSKSVVLYFYRREETSNNANEFVNFFSYPVTKYYREEYASKEFILKDKEKYFRDWGQRIYKNIRVNIIDIIANDEIKIKVVFNYVLNNGIKQIEGVSTHYLTIKKINGEPLITRIELGKK